MYTFMHRRTTCLSIIYEHIRLGQFVLITDNVDAQIYSRPRPTENKHFSL